MESIDQLTKGKLKIINVTTAIELLVVISVILILAGIATPYFKGVQNEANSSKAKSELRLIKVAVESYNMNQAPNAYPATSTTVSASTLNRASPLIIGDVLFDPFRSSAEYNYILSNNGIYYVAFSYGPDGATDITGINTSGVLQGANDDDIFATNGAGF